MTNPTVTIVDSGGANLSSVRNAFERLDITTILSDDGEVIRKASHVLLPGVGAAKDAMTRLYKKDLVECIKGLTQPTMGICLGMQLLFQWSQEGDVDLLNILDGKVNHFPPLPDLIVPHMGWNSITIEGQHPVLKDINQQDYFYFVHSYAVDQGTATIASSHHGINFTAIAAQDNFIGCQFHPEKSSASGAKILQNFITL